MKWQEKMTDNERLEMERAKAARDAGADVYRATVKKLKSRCESRMRAEKNGSD